MVIYGSKISEVANNVVQQVRYLVERDTGINPDSVQVVVQDVRMVD